MRNKDIKKTLSSLPPPLPAAPPPFLPAQAAATGAYKTSLPWWKIVLLGTVAGCYVGLGGALLLTGAQPASKAGSSTREACRGMRAGREALHVCLVCAVQSAGHTRCQPAVRRQYRQQGGH